jgi:hypothetical protein
MLRRIRVELNGDVVEKGANSLCARSDSLRIWVELTASYMHIADLSLYLHRGGFLVR